MAKTTTTTIAAGDGKKLYDITDQAPSHVAGQRVNGRKQIELSEPEARAELLAGHIRPKGLERKSKTV